MNIKEYKCLQTFPEYVIQKIMDELKEAIDWLSLRKSCKRFYYIYDYHDLMERICKKSNQIKQIFHMYENRVTVRGPPVRICENCDHAAIYYIYLLCDCGRFLCTSCWGNIMTSDGHKCICKRCWLKK